MLILRRLPVIIALILWGLALMALTLTASAAPNALRQYPSLTCPTTLQACIDGANPGDEIRIAPGTYTTSVTLNKAVSLLRDDSLGSGDVVLRALPGQRVLTITGALGPSTHVAGLTIEGGALATGNGGGILVLAPAQPSLHDLFIQNNVVSGTDALGGGLFTQSSLTITHTAFLDNNAVLGSGGGLAGAPGAALVGNGLEIHGNRADDSGGGLFVDSLTLSGSGGSANIADDGEGGGLYITGTASITGGDWDSNEAEGHGGAVYVGGSATLSGGVYQHNTSNQGSGAGLYIVGGLIADDTDIEFNDSFDSGGGLFVGGALQLTDSEVLLNESTGGSGAGVRASGTAVIANTLFLSNTAFNPGGGLRVTGAITLTDTDFIGNVSGASGGGLRTNADAIITGGTYAGNEGTVGGGAFVGGTLWLNGGVFQSNTASDEGGGLGVLTATVTGATFDNNTVLVGNGGGLSARNVLTISNSIFTANRVLSGTAANSTGSGGGLYSDDVLFSTSNLFVGNFTLRLGAGADSDATTSDGDVFRGNWTGPQGSGGGMFVAGPFTVNAGQFFTNTANTAGGLGVNSNATGNIINSLFARNVVTFADGGAAARLLSTTQVEVEHNTLVGINQAGRAAVHIQGSGQFTFTNNLLADFARGLSNFSGITITEDYNGFFNVPTPRIGPFNIGAHSFATTTDPLFANSAGFDFHLTIASLAVNAGTPIGVPDDFEGDLRGAFGDPVDIGFDEFVVRVLLPLVLRE